ncbi:hypothetical protein D3C75_694460 [compost metagenome]
MAEHPVGGTGIQGALRIPVTKVQPVVSCHIAKLNSANHLFGFSQIIDRSGRAPLAIS